MRNNLPFKLKPLLFFVLMGLSNRTYAELNCGDSPPSDTSRVQCLSGKWYQLTYDPDPTWGGWSGPSCKMNGSSNCTQNNEIYNPPTPTPTPVTCPAGQYDNGGSCVAVPLCPGDDYFDVAQKTCVSEQCPPEPATCVINGCENETDHYCAPLGQCIPSNQACYSDMPPPEGEPEPGPAPTPTPEPTPTPTPTPTPPDDEGGTSPTPTPEPTPTPPDDEGGTSPTPTPTPTPTPPDDGGGTSPTPTPPGDDGGGISPTPTPPGDDGGGTSPTPTPPGDDGGGTSPTPTPPGDDGGGTSPTPTPPGDDGGGTSPTPTPPGDDGGTSPTPTPPGDDDGEASLTPATPAPGFVDGDNVSAKPVKDKWKGTASGSFVPELDPCEEGSDFIHCAPPLSELFTGLVSAVESSPFAKTITDTRDKIKQLSSGSGSCPSFSIPMSYFNKPDIVVKAHCEMLELIRPFLLIVSIIAWSLLAIFIFLRA
ncbi:MAG: hypothetical protein Q8S52_18645 [Methylobacter sp.]|nr:hypothetical protein [Methylobacter sp.]